MTRLSLLLLLVSVGLTATAQLLLKSGMAAAARAVPGGLELGVETVRAVASSPFIYLGLACFGLSVLTWLAVLARLDVSQAYPFVALGIVITSIGGFFLLKEPVSAIRLAGIGLIFAGVFLVARS